MKLTQKHFELYRNECEKWIKILGLQSWKVFYEFKKLENAFGNISWDYQGRVATIRLAIDFPQPFDNLEQQIKETALHECLELLLSPLSDIASDRTFDKAELCQESHIVIRTLEKILINSLSPHRRDDEVNGMIG